MTTEAHSLTLAYKDGGLAKGTKAVNDFAKAGESASKSANNFNGKIGLLNTNLRTVGTVSLPKVQSGFDRFISGLKPAKNATQLLSFQMQDLAVQLAAGTRATVAFGQQLPQAFSAFGASGAVLGAIAGVGFALAGPLITAMTDVEAESETLADTISRLSSTFDDAADGSGILSEELVRLAKISREAVRLRLIVDQEDSANALTETRNAIVETVSSFADYRTALEKLSGVTRFDKLAEGLGITSDEAERLSAAIPSIAEKSNIGAYSELAKVLSDIKNQYGETNPKVSNLTKILSQNINRSIEAAEATNRITEANKNLDKALEDSVTKRSGGGAISDPEGERLKHLKSLYDEDVKAKEKAERAKTKIENEESKSRLAIQNFVLSSSASIAGDLAAIAREKGEEGFLAYKRLAQVQIAISTAMAVMRAFAEGGPIAGPILAGAVTAVGAAQIATVEQQQYSAARENGGQVQSGTKVLVGERGPEVLEIGAQGGFITPNSRLGGGGSITNVFQIGNNVQPNVRAEVMALAPDMMRMISQSIKGRR